MAGQVYWVLRKVGIKMQAVLENGPKQIEIKSFPDPVIQGDEILMKIRANGLCQNDVRDYTGDTKWTYPRVGGHEFSGEIIAVGNAVNPNHFQVGDHVVKYILPNCGECYYCKTGRPNLCTEIYSSPTFHNDYGISGFWGMSQLMAVKTTDLFKYPHTTSFLDMAFTEPLGCVINSVERANVQLGQDALVIGGGVMGLLHVMTLKLKGARVLVSEPNENRRRLALELGADFVFDPMQKDPVALVKNETDGRGADVVFNTTAVPAIAKQAIAFTANGGQTFMFSSMHPDDPVSIDLGAVHAHEKFIKGTVSPTRETYFRATQLISKKALNLRPLLDKTFPYTDAESAFQYAMLPETLKTMVTFD